MSWILSLSLLSAFVAVDGAEYGVGVNGDNVDLIDDLLYNPQQACKYWTTPGYRSFARELEGAPAKKLEDILLSDNDDDTYWSGSAVSCGWEPNLLPMTVQYGGGYNETYYAYVTPDVSTFYNAPAKSKKPSKLQFNGMFAKFVNFAHYPIQVYYYDTTKNNKKGDPSNDPYVYISDIEPFGSAGTATFPKHKFVITHVGKPNEILKEFTIDPDNSLYYYDPLGFDGLNQLSKLGWTDMQIHMYHIQLVNRAFAIQYKQFTGGTDWLALYKHKNPPRYDSFRNFVWFY
jgi:hypothetical protein